MARYDLQIGGTLGRPAGALWAADDDLQSVHRWRKAGVWDRLMDAVIAAPDGKVQMLDSSVRVHRQAAAQKTGWSYACIGRSRGGLTSKLHARVCDGLPVPLELSPGQANDAPMAE